MPFKTPDGAFFLTLLLEAGPQNRSDPDLINEPGYDSLRAQRGDYCSGQACQQTIAPRSSSFLSSLITMRRMELAFSGP